MGAELGQPAVFKDSVFFKVADKIMGHERVSSSHVRVVFGVDFARFKWLLRCWTIMHTAVTGRIWTQQGYKTQPLTTQM